MKQQQKFKLGILSIATACSLYASQGDSQEISFFEDVKNKIGKALVQTDEDEIKEKRAMIAERIEIANESLEEAKYLLVYTGKRIESCNIAQTKAIELSDKFCEDYHQKYD
ncbi:MAG: hypothetical protein U9N59_16805 [Campylobacterota bacterium]|nr:hypothetical protein [Campylobacterota bacterium]